MKFNTISFILKFLNGILYFCPFEVISIFTGNKGANPLFDENDSFETVLKHVNLGTSTSAFNYIDLYL